MADLGRNLWRDRIGNDGGFGSESLALLVRNTHLHAELVPHFRSNRRVKGSTFTSWAPLHDQCWGFRLPSLALELQSSCLCVSRFQGLGQIEIDAEKLRRFLLTGSSAINSISDDHGFSESVLKEMSDGVIEVIEHAGMT